MNRVGSCWDNALAESYFKSLKAEMIYGNKLVGANQMSIKIFEYIGIRYRKKEDTPIWDAGQLKSLTENLQNELITVSLNFLSEIS